MSSQAEIRLPFWPDNGPLSNEPQDEVKKGCSTPAGVINELHNDLPGIKFCKVIKKNVYISNGTCASECLYRQ